MRRNLTKFPVTKFPTAKFPVAKFNTTKILQGQIWWVENAMRQNFPDEKFPAAKLNAAKYIAFLRKDTKSLKMSYFKY